MQAMEQLDSVFSSLPIFSVQLLWTVSARLAGGMDGRCSRLTSKRRSRGSVRSLPSMSLNTLHLRKSASQKPLDSRSANQRARASARALFVYLLFRSEERRVGKECR